jgi:hypothetical protein
MGGDIGLKFGFPAELRTRVLVWRVPDVVDGWDLNALAGYEGEIRSYLSDFSFCDADSDSVSYRFGGGNAFSVDRGNFLVLSLDTLRLRRASEKYVLSMLHGIGL